MVVVVVVVVVVASLRGLMRTFAQTRRWWRRWQTRLVVLVCASLRLALAMSPIASTLATSRPARDLK